MTDLTGPFPIVTDVLIRQLESRLAGGALRLAGWKVEGSVPVGTAGILLVTPHTSNWDFLLGLLSTRTLGLHPRFLVKAALTQFPAGLLMRPLGALAVDRDRATGMVERGASLLRGGALLAVLPKGTRSSGPWRSGFYHMALAASVPVFPLVFDAGCRTVRALPPRWMTGDADADLEGLRVALSGVRGVNPAVVERVAFRDGAA